MIPIEVIKGRGSASHIQHRFATDTREVFDDGWGDGANDSPSPGSSPALKTEVIFETAKSALTTNDSPDLPFRFTLNPYRGCEHGCIYCFARPTHSYLGLSPGLDFESKIIAKSNIHEVLAQELQNPRYRPQVINVGGATDCYQPVERQLQLTRACLKVFAQTQHPFTVVTKSQTVERDLDLLVPMAQKNLVAIYITITTLDQHLARILEPRATAPQRRLRTIETLAKAGVPVGVSVSPQIPFINEDMEQVLQAAQGAGARSAFYTVLRLPWELAPLFRQWLELHYPKRAQRVMARVQEMHKNKDYDADFTTRMIGSGPWADLLGQRFDKAARRYGLHPPTRASLNLTCSHFDPRALSQQAQLF